MKTELRFRHLISAQDVRLFCIKHDLYTCGDNEAYAKMLGKCGYVTADELSDIAQDIVDHSPADHELWASYEPTDELVCYLCDLVHVETYLHIEHEPGDTTLRAKATRVRR